MTTNPSSDQQLYPLMQVADRPFVPRGTKGTGFDRKTILNWKKPRPDGRHLRTVQCNGRFFTCDAWVREFMEPGSTTQDAPKPLTVAQRARRDRAINRELDAAGL